MTDSEKFQKLMKAIDEHGTYHVEIYDDSFSGHLRYGYDPACTPITGCSWDNVKEMRKVLVKFGIPVDEGGTS